MEVSKGRRGREMERTIEGSEEEKEMGRGEEKRD